MQQAKTTLRLPGNVSVLPMDCPPFVTYDKAQCAVVHRGDTELKGVKVGGGIHNSTIIKHRHNWRLTGKRDS